MHGLLLSQASISGSSHCTLSQHPTKAKCTTKEAGCSVGALKDPPLEFPLQAIWDTARRIFFF